MKVTAIKDVCDFGVKAVEGVVQTRKDLADTKSGKKWFAFVLDDGTCDIKFSVFNDAERFFQLIETGRAYRIEEASFQLKNETSRKFDYSRSAFEGSLRSHTIVKPIEQKFAQHRVVSSTLQEVAQTLEVG